MIADLTDLVDSGWFVAMWVGVSFVIMFVLSWIMKAR